MKNRAHAKINLAMNVFGVRENGYHDIKSIMVPLDFYDELEINISDKDSFVCNETYLSSLSNNSIYKMIDVFKNKFNIHDHYKIILNKQIPSQAGLGGGTSDAGAALRILKQLYNLNLSKQDETELCVAVGADVLFNYYDRPAKVLGIGDIVEPFNMAKQYNVLLVKPSSGISTKEAYDTINMDICDHPDIDVLKNALETGNSIDGLLGNSLEQPSLLLNKDIVTIKELLSKNGAKNVLMSGSGSTVFAISEDYDELSKIYDVIDSNTYFKKLTKTI